MKAKRKACDTDMEMSAEQRNTRFSALLRNGLLVILSTICIVFTSCRPPSDAEQGGDSSEPARAGGRRANSRGGDSTAEPESAQAVEAQLTSREEFFGAIEASGVIRGMQEARVISETSGAIQTVRVQLGEAVRRGQVLVTLEDSLERFAVEQARDQLAVTELEFAATKELYDSGNSSEAELARAKSAVSGNRSRLAQVQRQLANRVIISPIDGQIALLPESISQGNFIQPGTAIATVVNLERVRIDIGLGEREIQMVSVDDRARVYTDACGRAEAQNAAVTALAAGSDNQSGIFTVKIEFPNRCKPLLKSGMSARVEIIDRDQETEIVIPGRALVREAEGNFVFIAKQDGNAYFAEQREIQISRILGDRVGVESGLDEQEILIVAPVQILEDGQKIAPTVIRG